jgi:hypothetical protein
MNRPKKLSGDQGKYIEYLESKLEKYSSKKTSVRAYLTLKKIVDDTSDLVIKGFNVEDAEGSMNNVAVVSEEALTSKDDKTFDRIFKFIDKIGAYTGELSAMEETILEEDIEREKDIIKGEGSVESFIFNR